MPLWLAVIKALHIGIFIEMTVLTVYYVRPVIEAVRDDRWAQETHFLLALWALWASDALSYVPVIAAYLLQDAQPTPATLMPYPVRVFGLAVELSVGAFFIAFGRDGKRLLWPRFWAWSGLMAALLLAVLVNSLPEGTL